MLISHNTFTYLPARRWWQRLLTFTWRCQTETIDRQAEYIDAADMRVRFNTREQQWYIVHGVAELVPVAEALPVLAALSIKAARVLIVGKPDKSQLNTLEWTFAQSGVTMYDGYGLDPWYKYYTCPDIYTKLIQYVASMRSRWGKLCPRLWHATHRKERNTIISLYDRDFDCLALDFVSAADDLPTKN